MSKCRSDWQRDEWGVGCASLLFELFELSAEEMLADKELLLEWLTAGTGKIARFGSSVANHLINSSDREGRPETTGVAKSLFEQLDSKRLIELANRVSLEDFYTFGELLNRLAFYRPSWSETFVSKFDWPGVLQILLKANTGNAYAVSKFVGSLARLGSPDAGSYSLRYVEDIEPFLVRAIKEDPVNTIESMHDIFWDCLGFAPRFLRGGKGPDERQLKVARSIVAQLDPADFANSMTNHYISGYGKISPLTFNHP